MSIIENSRTDGRIWWQGKFQSKRSKFCKFGRRKGNVDDGQSGKRRNTSGKVQKSKGLLAKDSEGKSRANANSSGVTPNEILQSMNGGKDSPARTATQKFSDMKNTLSNLGNKK